MKNCNDLQHDIHIQSCRIVLYTKKTYDKSYNVGRITDTM